MPRLPGICPSRESYNSEAYGAEWPGAQRPQPQFCTECPMELHWDSWPLRREPYTLIYMTSTEDETVVPFFSSHCHLLCARHHKEHQFACPRGLPVPHSVVIFWLGEFSQPFLLGSTLGSINTVWRKHPTQRWGTWVLLEPSAEGDRALYLWEGQRGPGTQFSLL